MYADSRARLLLQLYAYCGDAQAAAGAVDGAFVAAIRHWHRLGDLDTLDPWLRERAVRRLDGRSRVERARPASRPSTQNTRLLAALGALDGRSRRLVIIRRLGDVDLPTAAREVGLTDGAAEQSLARSASALHGAGVDVTPAGLQAGLSTLSDDLGGLPPRPARALRRAGSRRRYAVTALVAGVVAAVAAAAGAFSASRPLATQPATTPPTSTSPAPTTPTPSAPRFDAAYLLTADQLSSAGASDGWRARPATPPPTSTSVYGECLQAAVNPPPRAVWVRDFTTDPGSPRGRLRQVLQLAPSGAEATRAFRQIITGFSLCEGHQLVDYSRVLVIGDRASLIRLRIPEPGGTRLASVVVAESGAAVTVLLAQSPPGKPGAFGPTQLLRLAGTAVDAVCSESGGGCASPPYTISRRPPPHDETAHGFLSVVDLPVVPRITSPWIGTEPRPVSGNPSATACDQADFDGGGAGAVSSRSYVIPQTPELPTLLGLSETMGRFPNSLRAVRFLRDVTRAVGSCHKRQVTLSVLRSASFSSDRTSGRVWELRQKVSKTRALTFRVALVRFGATVAEVTFTPADGYDVTPGEFVALASRAATRLDD